MFRDLGFKVQGCTPDHAIPTALAAMSKTLFLAMVPWSPGFSDTRFRV